MIVKYFIVDCMNKEQLHDLRRNNLLNYIKEEFKNSKTEFKQAIGLSDSDYNNLTVILKGNRSFGETLARRIEQKLIDGGYSVAFRFLDNDDELGLKDVAWIKEYDVRLSAGFGEDISNQEVIDYHPLDFPTIKSMGWNIDKLCAFEVKNESMMNKYPPGIKVVVNTSDRYPITEGKVYAIRKNNEAFIKRVFREAGTDNYIGQSDNKIFGNISITPADDVDVIGRVVLKLSQLAD